MKKWSSFILGLMVFLFALVPLFYRAAEAQASCASPQPDFSGTWYPITGTSLISKIKFRFACGDHVGCPIEGECFRPYTGFYIQPTSSNGKNWDETKTSSSYRQNVRTAVYDFKDGRVYFTAEIKESGVLKDKLVLVWRIEWKNQGVEPTTGVGFYSLR